MKNFNKERGISILGVIFLCVIIVLVLSYFNISIKGVVESPTGEENFNYVGAIVKNVWDNYLKRPATYLWKDVWVDIFWKGFINNMERIRDGKPTDFDEAAGGLMVPLGASD